MLEGFPHNAWAFKSIFAYFRNRETVLEVRSRLWIVKFTIFMLETEPLILIHYLGYLSPGNKSSLIEIISDSETQTTSLTSK